MYYYFAKWSADGTWERVSGCLSIVARERAKKKAQPTAVILDSQSVKNTATSTHRVGYDAGKRIKGRKRFFLVDTLGNLPASCVVAANCHDGTTATKVWDAWALHNELLD